LKITTILILLTAGIASVCALRLWDGRSPFPRLLLVWVLASAVVEFVGIIGNRMGFVNVRYYNAFILIEFLLLMRIAMLHPVVRFLRRPYIHVIMGAFTLVWAVDLYSIGWEVKFATYAFLIGTPIIVAVYLFLLWDLVNTLREPLTGHAPFWLYLTVLVFYGTVAPILGSVNYFAEFAPHVGSKIMPLVSVMSIVKFILLSVTCLRAQRQPPLPA
jgi:hypothetical protein